MSYACRRAIAHVAILYGAALAFAQAPQRGVTGLCSVEGQVVDVVTNAPVRKALVALRKFRESARRTTLSDSNGRFQFQNVPAGEYMLSGQARNYLQWTEDNAFQPRRSGTVLSLAVGQSLSGAVLRLTPSAAVSGRIVDEDGDPVSSVDVQLWRISYERGRRELAAENNLKSATDDRGIYRIAAVPPGRYYLSASRSVAPNWPPEDTRYPRIFYAGSIDPAGAASIEMAPGTEIDGIGLTLSKVQTVRVRGQVLSPLPASITLYPDSALSADNSYMATESIAPGGKFEFDGVVPGAYNLLVTTHEGIRAGSAHRLLTVGPAGVDGLAVSPNPPVTITGRIRVEGGGDARTLSQTKVEFWPAFLTSTLTHTQPVTKESTFKMPDLTPGRYRVSAAGTPTGYYLKTVRVGNQDSSAHALDLSTGATEVELLFSPKAARVTGTVFFSDSETPAPEALVVLVPQGKERREDEFAYATATTDDAGKFAIGHIAPGEYRAFAWAFGLESHRRKPYMDPDFIGRQESKGTVLALDESAQADIKLSLVAGDLQY